MSASTPPPADADLANSSAIIRSLSASSSALNPLRKSVINASEENVQDPNPDKDIHMTIGEARHREEEEESNQAVGGAGLKDSSGSSSSCKNEVMGSSNCEPTN